MDKLQDTQKLNTFGIIVIVLASEKKMITGLLLKELINLEQLKYL